MRRRLHVIAIGGSHQYAHFLPVAFELHRRGALSVRIFVPDGRAAREVAQFAAGLDLPAPQIVEMRLPAVFGAALDGAGKLPRLLWWTRHLRNADAILTAERTSTILRRLPGPCPTMLHIPHGAGDRAVGFEKRIALFDHVLTAGAKDRERMIAAGLIAAERCHVVGPIKLAAMTRLHRDREPLFRNDRPVVLYNPHFDRKLNSFASVADRLIEIVRADDRWNLVVAPHVRLADRWSAEQRRAWEARAVPDKIVVDLGSPRSIDMSYTLSADIYVGDVSSQVYEFLVRPRPCLFINAHGAAWEGSEDYAMWRFGPVIAPDADFAAAIAESFATHHAYRAVQQSRALAAFGETPWRKDAHEPDAIAVAASLIEELCDQIGR